jgi:hypothetical protein
LLFLLFTGHAQATWSSRGTKKMTTRGEDGVCNTDKSKTQKAKMAQTAGINMFVCSCGIIFSFFEMYGAESATHINVHILQLFSKEGDNIRLFLMWGVFYFGYDDHCHLWPMMLCMTSVSTVVARFVKIVQPIMKRLHLINHSTKCVRLYNPDNHIELKGVNAIVAEQTFQWLKRHRFCVRHMGRCHFRFYMLRIMHLHNIRKARILSPSQI